MTPTLLAPSLSGPQIRHVRVVGAPHAYGIESVEPIDEGGFLFDVDGLITRHPSRYSIQVDDAAHIDLAPGTPLEEMVVRYPWRFLNHSCEPNAVFRGRTFVALRKIDACEPVTYNYNTTELDMAAPFDCRCGHASCLGYISGFAHLSPAAQTSLAPWLSEYLRRRLDSSLQFAPL